jgi:hypothetical protein
VKLSEGGRRDILMKEDLNSGLYQVKGDHRNDATFYKDWEQLEDLEAKRPMTKEDFFRCKPLPSHRSCGREQQSSTLLIGILRSKLGATFPPVEPPMQRKRQLSIRY